MMQNRLLIVQKWTVYFSCLLHHILDIAMQIVEAHEKYVYSWAYMMIS